MDKDGNVFSKSNVAIQGTSVAVCTFMPELYLKIYELIGRGEIAAAREIQDTCCHIIYKMCSCRGNMYAAIKGILRLNAGLDIGSVRKPLAALVPEDEAIVREAAADINAAIAKYCQ